MCLFGIQTTEAKIASNWSEFGFHVGCDQLEVAVELELVGVDCGVDELVGVLLLLHKAVPVEIVQGLYFVLHPHLLLLLFGVVLLWRRLLVIFSCLFARIHFLAPKLNLLLVLLAELQLQAILDLPGVIIPRVEVAGQARLHCYLLKAFPCLLEQFIGFMGVFANLSVITNEVHITNVEEAGSFEVTNQGLEVLGVE